MNNPPGLGWGERQETVGYAPKVLHVIADLTQTSKLDVSAEVFGGSVVRSAT